MRSIFKNMTKIGALGAVMLIAAPGHAANLIQNGSFENPVSTGSYTQLSAGQLPNWNITSGNVDVVKSPYPAFADLQSLDLVGTGVSTGSISQSFTTDAGKWYKLQFAYTNNTDSNALLSANYLVSGAESLLSGVVEHSSATPGWGEFSGYFKADSALTTLTFSDKSGQPNQGIFLDAVSVGVPEPTTWAMMILGLGVVGGVMRRRQQVAVRYA